MLLSFWESSEFDLGMKESTILIEPAPIANATYGKPLNFTCTCPDPWQSAALKILGKNGFKFATFKDVYCQVPIDRERFYSVACSGNTITFGILHPVDNVTWQCIFAHNSVNIGNNVTKVNINRDPPTLKPSNKTTVREGTSDVRLFCDVVTDGNPAKYSNLIWQHWIGNTFIRKLDPDNLPNGSPIKTFSLTVQSISFNDIGTYICLTTSSGVGGNITQSASTELVVEAIPRVLLTTNLFYRQVEKSFEVRLECVGNPPVSSLKVNTKLESSPPPFYNKTKIEKPISLE
uniref:Ig-like domain-containing protein n=1 Tax=Magallana gigas TaxID=29159 RepID=A0A8W8L1F9_MAGGI